MGKVQKIPLGKNQQENPECAEAILEAEGLTPGELLLAETFEALLCESPQLTAEFEAHFGEDDSEDDKAEGMAPGSSERLMKSWAEVSR